MKINVWLLELQEIILASQKRSLDFFLSVDLFQKYRTSVSACNVGNHPRQGGRVEARPKAVVQFT